MAVAKTASPKTPPNLAIKRYGFLGQGRVSRTISPPDLKAPKQVEAEHTKGAYLNNAAPQSESHWRHALGQKLILLELNEVPYRVIDHYVRRKPNSTLARILPRSHQYETVTEDRLALDPWISWPTFHRGVTDESHQILHLGQVLSDVDSLYPPIWRVLRERGVKVGVFGSLHSSSVPKDVDGYSFYLPDYFGSTAFAHPPTLTSFQELNLAMTRQSARNVSRKMPLGSVLNFMKDAPSMGISASTAGAAARHLMREVMNPSLRIRRRAYQPLLMADLFLKQLKAELPDFATFYTNHVAAAMHRYWGAAFPGDYEQPLDTSWVNQYCQEIEFAMDKFDIVLAKLVNFVGSFPEYTLLVASSMGQAAIPAEQTYEFLTITDISRFMRVLGVPDGAWESKPAMVPCHCVLVKEPYRDLVVEGLGSLSVGGAKVQWRQRPTAPMSCDERERGFFQFFVQFDNYSGPQMATLNGDEMALADAGLGLMAHEDGVNCTAQHVPNGAMFAYKASHDSLSDARPLISTIDVAPSIMKFFGFEQAAYMSGRPSFAAALQ